MYCLVNNPILLLVFHSQRTLIHPYRHRFLSLVQRDHVDIAQLLLQFLRAQVCQVRLEGHAELVLGLVGPVVPVRIHGGRCVPLHLLPLAGRVLRLSHRSEPPVLELGVVVPGLLRVPELLLLLPKVARRRVVLNHLRRLRVVCHISSSMFQMADPF